MHRLTSAFVLGYHGCKSSVADKLIARTEGFRPSENTFDWLGHGVYFWLENPKRACEWARKQAARPEWIEAGEHPAVVGAVIELGLCLDLTTTSGIEEIQMAHEVLKAVTAPRGRPMPVNTHKSRDGDILIRRLDCAVINLVHHIRNKSSAPAIDTVKGVFPEGGPAFDGAAIMERTHVQLAVRNPNCIKGIFHAPHGELVGESAECLRTTV